MDDLILKTSNNNILVNFCNSVYGTMQSVPTTISLEFYNLRYRLTTLYCQMAILSMLIFGLLITKSGSCPSVRRVSAVGSGTCCYSSTDHLYGGEPTTTRPLITYTWRLRWDKDLQQAGRRNSTHLSPHARRTEE